VVCPITYVSYNDSKPLKLSPQKVRSFTKGGINITAISGSKVVVRAAGWEVDITRRGLYKPMKESKTRHFLDMIVRHLTTAQAPVHGVIGQSFDPLHAIHTDGKRDNYTAAVVTTTAQAEGAIEGVYTDYMLASPHDTEFKYSRFEAWPISAAPVATSSVALADSAFTETNEAV